MLSMSPRDAETFIMLVFPVVVVAVLLLVPFVSNRGERAPSRRPVAVLLVVVIFTMLGVLTYLGVTAPWSPKMDAWTGDPVPVAIVERSNVSRLMGGALFQYKNCRNCHALDGVGGRRGPDLTTVGTRLTRDQLIDQISNGTPGGGLMPAYGKQLSPAEMEIMVDFLVGLRPEGQPAAGWATPVASLGEEEPTQVDEHAADKAESRGGSDAKDQAPGDGK
jgi:ubiquinol-cytochrome c reductase cytochrome b subunit